MNRTITTALLTCRMISGYKSRRRAFKYLESRSMGFWFVVFAISTVAVIYVKGGF